MYSKQKNMAPGVKPIVALMDDIFNNMDLSDEEKTKLGKKCTDAMQVHGLKFHEITLARRENILAPYFTENTLRR